MKNKLEVGSKVRFKMIVAPLKHRFAKGDVFGIVTNINGEYIDVRPMWCKWITECYPNELVVQ